jgi:hypothetical protein
VIEVVDVRRLAALDMWGSAGSRRRRRVIRIEFFVGAAGCFVLGALVVASASSVLWLAMGFWLVGVGLNYVPLALYAQALSRPGVLEDELRDADMAREIRRAGVQQLWIAVPCAVAIAAATHTRRGARR